MSEKKLYAVKNDEGEWLSFDYSHESVWDTNNPTLFNDKSYAEAQSMGRKDHVVELVEPKKVVLTKGQAETVKSAHGSKWPALLIDNEASGSKHEEELLMNAYVNGYTLAKDKKYNVKVPYADYTWYLKTPDGKLDTIWVKGLSKGFGGYPDGIELTNDDIEKFGLQDCEKEEVTDDEQ